MRRRLSLLVLLALAIVNSGAAAQRPVPGTIAEVKPQQGLAVANQAVALTIRTQGQCGLFKLEFGDGTSATSAGAAVSANGGAFFYTLAHSLCHARQEDRDRHRHHELRRPGNGRCRCGRGAGSAGTPVLPPPPFTMLSVSYGYVSGDIVATAALDTAKLPYPPPSGPKLSNNSTVVFSFRPHLPDECCRLDASVMWGQPLCSPHVRGPCPFKFILTAADGDVGPSIDSRRLRPAPPGGRQLHPSDPHSRPRPAAIVQASRAYAVYMEMQYQGNTYATKKAVIERGPTIENYFKRFIYPTFQSERCTNCHSMGDHDAIVNQHALHNVTLDKVGGSDPEVQPGQTALCANCHLPSHVTDWRTPPFSKGINWKQMNSWSEVCGTVIAHLRAQNLLVETPQSLAQLKDNLRNHFHNDPRVKWAIGDAFAAPPVAQQLERAKPGHWDQWLAIVDPWIDFDDHCYAD